MICKNSATVKESQILCVLPIFNWDFVEPINEVNLDSFWKSPMKRTKEIVYYDS